MNNEEGGVHAPPWHEPISHWMLKTARGYVIKHKKIFLKAIIAFADTLPEPTSENTYRKGIEFWLEEREKFRKYHCNPKRQPMIDAMWKIFIAEIEHDEYYADLIDVVTEDIRAEEEWPERMALHPLPDYWTEPYKGNVKIITCEATWK